MTLGPPDGYGIGIDALVVPDGPLVEALVRMNRWAIAASAIVTLVLLPKIATAQLPSPLAEPITPIPVTSPENTLRTALGRNLFDDPRLSSNGAISCASCHDLRSNGASAAARDAAPDGRHTALNTPTVFNAVLGFRLQWHGDARTLAEQAGIALTDPNIMASTPTKVLTAVYAEPGMNARFQGAYGHTPTWPLILDAIATFERTLTTPNSRFDFWLRGDHAALSDTEISGYHLFKSVGCVSCHQGVGVGGNLFERVGVADKDLYNVGSVFRVPSLRNVAVTAPYFHNGSALTLTEAVHRMGTGQLGLNLSDKEVASIISFLQTLTGRYENHPVSPASGSVAR